MEDITRCQLLKLLLCMVKTASLGGTNPKLRAAVKDYVTSSPMQPAVAGVRDAGDGPAGEASTVTSASASLAFKVLNVVEAAL